MHHRWVGFLISLGSALGLAAPLAAPPKTASMSEAEITATCQQILKKIQRWESVEQAFTVAHDLFPDNPVFRPLQMLRGLPTQVIKNAVPFEHQPSRSISVRRRRYLRETVATYDWLVPAIGTGRQPSLRAIPDFESNSIRFVGVRDAQSTGRELEVRGQDGYPSLVLKDFRFVPHRGSKAIVNWSAGLTGVVSNAGRVFNQIRVMNSIRKSGITESLLHSGDNPYWVETAASTIDVPYHGSGPYGRKYLNLDETVQWRRQYYRSLGQHGLPVIGACRSGENLPMSLAADYFQAMIWMSPMHPLQGYGETLNGYLEQNIKRVEGTGREPAINPIAFDWFTKTRDQMLANPNGWWNQDHPFEDKPVLILVGERDLEVPMEARVAFRQMAMNNPTRIFYVEVPGASHDVFSVTEDWHGNSQRWNPSAEERAAKVWTYVYWFIRSQVLNDQSVQVPPHGWLLH